MNSSILLTNTIILYFSTYTPHSCTFPSYKYSIKFTYAFGNAFLINVDFNISLGILSYAFYRWIKTKYNFLFFPILLFYLSYTLLTIFDIPAINANWVFVTNVLPFILLFIIFSRIFILQLISFIPL